MLDHFQTTATLSALLVMGAVGVPAFAQSDPSAFGTVFNIGDVSPGSIFDVTSADIPGTVVPGTQFADVLGSDSQLNLFINGELLNGFVVGPADASGSEIEVNIFGGLTGSFTVNAGGTVNVSSGTIDSGIEVKSGGTLNISGGTFQGVSANPGSIVNFSGGSGGDSFLSSSHNSMVTISGGTLASGFSNNPGSTLNIVGGVFQLNGSAVSDLSAGFGESRAANSNPDLLTGILQDGSVFIFAGRERDYFAPDTATLVNAPVAASTNPGMLTSGMFSKGLRSGETLTVADAGRLGDYFSVVGGTLNYNTEGDVNGLRAVSGEVNISAGNFIDFYVWSGSTVNISGGSIGNGFSVTSGNTMTISGGNIGHQFRAESGSMVTISGGNIGDLFFTGGVGGPDNTVNISGGNFGFGFDISRGATVNISGGSFGNRFRAYRASTVNISGGRFGDGFEAFASDTETSAVTIMGGAFELNGVATSDLSAGFGGDVGVPNSDLFTGLLADGTVFIFSGQEGDRFAPRTTTLVNAPVAASTNPGTLMSGTFSKGLRSGETLTVTGAGKLGDNFAVVGGTLNYEADAPVTGLEVVSGEINISAGHFSDFDAFLGSIVNISGGSIDSSFEAKSGTTINISGGTVSDDFSASSGSTVNISAGTVGPFSRATSDSVVNISGGKVDYFFDAWSGSTVTISGGNVGSSFGARSGSTVTITGGSVGRNFAARTGSTVKISGGTIGPSFLQSRPAR